MRYVKLIKFKYNYKLYADITELLLQKSCNYVISI